MTNLFDYLGNALKDPDGNIAFARGSSVPADTTAGYAIGCLFQYTGGGVGTAMYINEGTTTSCDFNAMVGTNTLGAATATSLTATGAVAGGTVTSTGLIKSSSPGTAGAGGIGYATGAGLAATQSSNKSTTVTNGDPSTCGTITMNNAALNAGVIVSFTFTNAAIAATDVLVLNHVSGGTVGSYTLNAQAGAGSATINVRNNTAGNLSEAIVIQWALIKAVAA